MPPRPSKRNSRRRPAAAQQSIDSAAEPAATDSGGAASSWETPPHLQPLQADDSGEDNDDNENGEEDTVMVVPEPLHTGGAKRARINGKQMLFAEVIFVAGLRFLGLGFGVEAYVNCLRGGSMWMVVPKCLALRAYHIYQVQLAVDPDFHLIAIESCMGTAAAFVNFLNDTGVPDDVNDTGVPDDDTLPLPGDDGAESVVGSDDTRAPRDSDPDVHDDDE